MESSMVQWSDKLPHRGTPVASGPDCEQWSFTADTHSYSLPVAASGSFDGQCGTEVDSHSHGRRRSGQTPVGTLIFRHAKHNEYGPAVMTLFENDCVDVGRPDFLSRWGLNDLGVSTHHLRFRCLVYGDQLEMLQVPPMVYVRVLSSKPSVFRVHGGLAGAGPHVVSNFDGDVLLNDGDELQLTPAISAVFNAAAPASNDQVVLNASMLNDAHRFAGAFHVMNRALGVGGHAVVVLSLSQPHRRQLACKIVPVRVNTTDRVSTTVQGCTSNKYHSEAVAKRMRLLAREFTVLETLSHPNIIKLERVIVATENVFIFQELVTGGDLLSHLDREGKLNEPQTVAIIRQILEAVKYLHDNDVVHRDIKPENVLLTSWRDGTRIVLTDFGQARTLKKDAATASILRMKSIVGTYGYTAPEVLQQLASRDRNENGYSRAIDIWSIGSIAALALTNELMLPKQEKDRTVSPAKVETVKPTINVGWDIAKLEDARIWHGISPDARSFVRHCLRSDESRRPTAEAALSDPWIMHAAYKNEAEAAYQRAISEWKPRQSTGDIVQYLDALPSPSHAAHGTDRDEVPGHLGTSYQGEAADPPIAYGMPAWKWGPPPRRARTPLPSIQADLDLHDTRLDHLARAEPVQSRSQKTDMHFSARSVVEATGRLLDIDPNQDVLSSSAIRGVWTRPHQPAVYDMHSRYFDQCDVAARGTEHANAAHTVNLASKVRPAMQDASVGARNRTLLPNAMRPMRPLWEEQPPRKRPCRW